MDPEQTKKDIKMLIERVDYVDNHIEKLASQIGELKAVVKELRTEIMRLASSTADGLSTANGSEITKLLEGREPAQASDAIVYSSLDSIDFIRLPRHLRDIYQELLKSGKEASADEVVRLPRSLQAIYLSLLRIGKDDMADRIVSSFFGLKKHLQETYIALINSRKEASASEFTKIFDDLPDQLQETCRTLLKAPKEASASELSNSFFNLSKKQQETYWSLLKAGKGATADEIAEITARKRPVESDYLNQLHGMNLVLKYRRGKKVFFSLNWIDPISIGIH
ncbi:MAG: hypothetical protein ACFFD4_10660 [Candidatus Odinarchaeota archaeon]